MSTAELSRAIRTADHCHGIVTRDGVQDACGKPPVAIVNGAAWDEGYWPACAYHAHRYGGGACVTLSEVLRTVLAPALDGSSHRPRKGAA